MFKDCYLEEMYVTSFKCGSNGLPRNEVWIIIGNFLNPSLYLPNGIVLALMWNCWFKPQTPDKESESGVPIPFPSCCTWCNCVQLHGCCCQTGLPEYFSRCLSIPCRSQSWCFLVWVYFLSGDKYENQSHSFSGCCSTCTDLHIPLLSYLREILL